MKKIISLAILVLAISTLSGCITMTKDDSGTETETTVETDSNTSDPETYEKQLFPSNFSDACNGVMIVGSAAYDKTVAGIHHIYVFEQDGGQYYERSTVLPDAWKQPWEQAKDTQLVVCLKITDESLNQTCEFEDEGEPLTLELYDATYSAELYEASTGNQLANTTFELKNEECPIMYFFSDTVEKDYPDYDQTLTDFVKEYVQI